MLPAVLQPLASALAVKPVSELHRAAVTAKASPLWSAECSNRVDNDPANLLPPPCLLPLACVQGRAGGLMSILFWTTFTEGKCINSWSASTLYSVQSSEGARMSQGEGESLMHVSRGGKKKKKRNREKSGADRTRRRWDGEGDLRLCRAVWQRARKTRSERHKWLLDLMISR